MDNGMEINDESNYLMTISLFLIGIGVLIYFK